MDGDDRTSERLSLVMAKASSFLPEEESLEVGLHLSRHSRESTKSTAF